VLTLARLEPTQERGHNAIACVEPSGKIRDRDADFHWRTVAAARDVHQTELGLNHNVVARSLCVGTSLAVARDGGVDDTRVDLVNTLKVEAVFLQRAREVVFDEDVALRCQFVQDVNAGFMLK